MMATHESYVVGVYKAMASQQGFSSAIRVVTVPLSLLSLSSCTSYTHQSHIPALHCSNECPTFLLFKLDDVPLKLSFFCNFFFMFHQSSQFLRLLWYCKWYCNYLYYGHFSDVDYTYFAILILNLKSHWKMDKNVVEEEGTRRHKSKGDSLNVGKMIKMILCVEFVFFTQKYTLFLQNIAKSTSYYIKWQVSTVKDRRPKVYSNFLLIIFFIK